MSEEENKSVTVSIDENAVKDLLGEKVNVEQEAPQPERESVKLDREEFVDPESDSVDNMLKAFVREKPKVTIDDADKLLYLKSVMNNAPLVMDIPLCGGSIVYTFRSRSTYEQNLLIDTLSLKALSTAEEGATPGYKLNTQIQEFIVCISLLRTNTSMIFEPLDLSEITNKEEALSWLDWCVKEYIRPLSDVQWTLLLQALNIFEEKKMLMHEACLNQDFWTPAS